MRVLIAGGSGILGRAVTPLLLDAGHDVTATTRTPQKLEQIARSGARPALMDALEPDAVHSTLEQAAPEVVVDLLTDLAHGSSASNAHLRSVATRHLVDAACSTGVHRLIAESIAWIYRPCAEPAAETEPLDLDAPEPRRTTVRAVAALEAAARELADSVILRLGLLYGPGTWYSPDSRYALDARTGALSASSTITSFIHIDDAATAITASINWPAGTYNIVDDEPAPGTEWVPVFAAAVGSTVRPARVAAEPGRPATNARARMAGLNLQHPTWRDGLGTT